MKRRLQTWGLAVILGLALSAAFDSGHLVAGNRRTTVAEATSAPGR